MVNLCQHTRTVYCDTLGCVALFVDTHKYVQAVTNFIGTLYNFKFYLLCTYDML